jgi:hypothetical protein
VFAVFNVIARHDQFGRPEAAETDFGPTLQAGDEFTLPRSQFPRPAGLGRYLTGGFAMFVVRIFVCKGSHKAGYAGFFLGKYTN